MKPIEGRDDPLFVHDHDDGRVVLQGPLVEAAQNGQGALAVQRCRGFVGQDQRWPLQQRAGDRDALLLAPGSCRRLRLRAVADVTRNPQVACAFARPCRDEQFDDQGQRLGSVLANGV